MRCARDTLSSIRLAALQDVAAHPDAGTEEIRQRPQKPRDTVARTLSALQLLKLLTCREVEVSIAGKFVWRCFYTLAQNINLNDLTMET